MNRSFLFIFIAYFSILSCKKSNDTLINITVTSPFKGLSYSIYDTIILNCKVRSNEIINKITVSIVKYSGNNEIQIDEFYSISPESKEYAIDKSLTINNFEIESGEYYLKIKASTENQSKSHFINIYINELEKKRI